MWSPNALMRALADRDGWVCVYCEKKLAHLPEHLVEITSYDETEHVWTTVDGFVFPQTDHVVPSSRGGSNDFENRVLACAPCNSAKGSRPVEEWLLSFIGEAA